MTLSGVNIQGLSCEADKLEIELLNINIYDADLKKLSISPLKQGCGKV